MKLGTLIKKASVVTVENGWLQASDNGAIFMTYLPKAEGLSFAVSAKAFIEALKVLETDYRFVLNKEDNYLVMFDLTQEIKLWLQPSEIWVTAPTKWIDGDVATPWVEINEFTTASYPAVRLTSQYFESLTTNCIARLSHCFNFESKNIMTYKILKNSESYAFDKKFLWFKYNGANYIGLSYLDIELPSTDSFFQKWDTGRLIPYKLHSKLVTAEFVKFENNNLLLTTEHTMSAEIENIEGSGRYEYSFFKKALQKGLTWFFDTRALCITGKDFKIVLGDLGDR